MGLKYRYRHPVIVEAFQMTEERRWGNRDWPEWLNRAWNGGHTEVGSMFPLVGNTADRVCIRASDGVHAIEWGDWIMRGPDGELYVCHDDEFQANYQQIDIEPEEKLNWTLVLNSSNVQGFGFDEGTGELTVEYTGGARYAYFGVPTGVVEKLRLAESKGKFINANIKGAYQFQKLEPVV